MLNYNDLFIIDKVFPSDWREIASLLCSKENTSIKIDNYMRKRCHQVVNKSNTLPLNMTKFLKVLQQDFILPNNNAITLTKLPVFFALSKYIQHNILIFLKEYNFSSEDENEWKTFLQKNATQLDDWSNVICGIKSNHMVFSEKLQTRLCNLKRPSTSGFLPMLDVKKTNVSVDLIEIESDGEDFMTFCEVEDKSITKITNFDTVIKTESSIAETTLKSVSQSNKQKSIEVKIKGLLSTGYDTSSPLLKEHMIDPKIVNEMYTACSKEILSEIFQLFSKADAKDKEIFCKELNLTLLKEESLSILLDYLDGAEGLTLEYTHCVIYHAVTLRLLQLQEPITRVLLSLLVQMIQKHQQYISMVLCKLFKHENLNSLQEDVLKKLLLHDSSRMDNVSCFLNQLFDLKNTTINMNEYHVSLLELLFQTNPHVTNHSLSNLIVNLSRLSLNKSLKLMKLIMVVVSNFHTILTDFDKGLLYRVVNQNTSFLKKKALKLLDAL